MSALPLEPEDFARSYCGLVSHDEGDHWVLTWFGRPIHWGTEEEVDRAYGYFALRLAPVLESFAATRIERKRRGGK